MEKISFGGPLQFRFKLSNARGKRALFNGKQATVLEDYLRLDRNLFVTDLQNNLPHFLAHFLHEVTWSLGLQLPPATLQALVTNYIQEVNV